MSRLLDVTTPWQPCHQYFTTTITKETETMKKIAIPPDRPVIIDTCDKLKLPGNWCYTEGKVVSVFLQLQAGRAYLLDQLGITSEPEHEFRDGSVAYLVFADDSLLYFSEGGDEVYTDFREMARQIGRAIGTEPLQQIDRDLLALC